MSRTRRCAREVSSTNDPRPQISDKVSIIIGMKIAAATTVLLLAASSLAAQSRPVSPTAPSAKTGEQEVTYEGELETYVAIGGESTGWRLRRRTPEGRRQYIELLLTAELAQGLRAHTRVQVRGNMKTHHYAERGDVQVLAVKDVIEVARR